MGAARALVLREPRQLAALVGRSESKIGTLAATHSYIDLLTYAPPSGKDGFLATSSLFASAVLLARAYFEPASVPDRDSVASMSVHDAADPSSALVAEWRRRAESLWERETTIVLHGASSAVGAVDLESKFTEAAVGHAQIADYRNFAHGRHHWLAKRGDRSAVLAFVGDDDREIAERTLSLLPEGIPIVRIQLDGSPTQASLLSLLAAFHITAWAGRARGIDPGDPGVPEFGRRIYHLTPPRAQNAPLPSGLTRRSAAAIERKTGRTVPQLSSTGELKTWRAVLNQFRGRLAAQPITGLVLDYDGTVVDTRDRFDPPIPEIVAELVRLLRAGVAVGIATGRGKSVRQALQSVLPSEVWPRVIVGYYNGAELGLLGDDSTPSHDQAPIHVLRNVADALAEQPELSTGAIQDVRRHQVTLTPQGSLGEERLWAIVQSVVRGIEPEVQVVRSSHSIDVLAPGVSKVRVVDRVREIASQGTVLTIGDRGHWPGNDAELLAMDASLSVDQQSPAPDTCWNLGAPGQRGLATTVEYLRSIEIDHAGHARLNEKALR